MPIMEVQTVTKKVAIFRTPCLSPNELIILMSYSLYNEQDDHFEDMEIKYRDINPDIITSEEAKQIGIDFYKIMGKL